jgi:hypothetical protein
MTFSASSEPVETAGIDFAVIGAGLCAAIPPLSPWLLLDHVFLVKGSICYSTLLNIVNTITDSVSGFPFRFVQFCRHCS